MRDLTAEQFESDVITASHQRPVVVDFWAPWCGPCHQLSPLLEKVAGRYADDVDAVKLNVDQAPAVAQRYRVQGIPAVKAFRDGKVVGEFVGVQSEAVIESLFAQLRPSRADRLLEQALSLGDDEKAEQLLREAVDDQRDHAAAIVALARVLSRRGDEQEAKALLARLPQDPQARRMLAELELAGTQHEDLEALRAAAADGNADAALRLGRALAAAEQYAEALPLLLTAVRDPRTRDEARGSVLMIFAVAGDESDIVRTWRPRLAAALF